MCFYNFVKAIKNLRIDKIKFKENMIHGIILTAWGALCLITAFFTKNTYCFVWIPPHIRNAWGKPTNPKNNKLINIIGGLIFLFIGLSMLK